MQKYYIYILLIIIYSNFSYAEDRTNEINLYKQAHSLIDDYSGDSTLLYQANEIALKIININKNSEYAYVLLGRIAYKAGYINYSNYNKESLILSETQFSKAIAINPRFFDAYIYGASPYIYSKNYTVAKKNDSKGGKH